VTDASLLTLASTVVSGIVAIGVAKVNVEQYKERKANEERAAEATKREELRQEGLLLQMKMADATLDLGLITAKTVLERKTNGDVEEALDKAMTVKEKITDHLQRVCQAI
jgi:hypothetical protein